MSLNLSTLNTTNSIINLENQINELGPQLTNLENEITTKQNIIEDGDLTIAKTSNLENTLNNKQETITAASVLPGFNISNSGTLKFPSNGTEAGKIQFFKPNNTFLSKNIDYDEIENLETDIASKQQIITSSTNLPGFNISSGSNINFLSSGTASGNINFFNPTNQLDVKQLNFNELVSIEDSIDTLNTTKENTILSSTNLNCNSLTTVSDISIGGVINSTGASWSRGGLDNGSIVTFTPVVGSNMIFTVKQFPEVNCIYDDVNHTLTIQKSGKYLINYGVVTGSNNSTLIVKLVKNGVDVYIGMSNSASTSTIKNVVGSILLNLNVNDILTLVLQAGTLFTSQAQHYYNGFLIG
jgi:hypothetical protein